MRPKRPFLVMKEPKLPSREEKGWGGTTRSPQEQIRQSFSAIEGTISSYTNHTLNAPTN